MPKTAYITKATEEIRLITGQQPVISISKKINCGFKVHEGMPLGLTVTLRRERCMLLKHLQNCFTTYS
jgi:large subunit ribosomal protein L5